MQLDTQELETILMKYTIISSMFLNTVIIMLLLYYSPIHIVVQLSNYKELHEHCVTKQTVVVDAEVFDSTQNVISVNVLKKEKVYGEYFINPQPAMEYTDDDLFLLATVIFSEAGICDEMEKYRVGNVVLNRVNNETYEFGNTIEEVIYAEGQFSSVGGENWEHGPTDEEISIAKDLLEGKRVFNEEVVWFARKRSYGELYYRSEWHEYSGLEVEEEADIY